MADFAVSRGAYDAQIFTKYREKPGAAGGHNVSHSNSLCAGDEARTEAGAGCHAAAGAEGGFRVEVQHFRKGDSCLLAKHYQHLDYAERVLIQTQLSLGLKPCLIADGLKRSRSILVWEIRRSWIVSSGPPRPSNTLRLTRGSRAEVCSWDVWTQTRRSGTRCGWAGRGAFPQDRSAPQRHPLLDARRSLFSSPSREVNGHR